MAEKGENDNRPFDLEERTYAFAKEVRGFVKKLERTLGNVEDAKQLIRSSGSVAANYIEANESLSNTIPCNCLDFVTRSFQVGACDHLYNLADRK